MSSDNLQSLLKVEHLQLYFHFSVQFRNSSYFPIIMALKFYSLVLMPDIYLLCTSAISYVVNYIFQVHMEGGRLGSRELPVLQFEAKSRFPRSKRYVAYFALKLQNLMHSKKSHDPMHCSLRVRETR